MSTYKIIVEFERSRDDDYEVVKAKYGGVRLENKFAAQLAVELQAAYVHPDCELAGNFQILHVSAHDGSLVEISEIAQRLVNKEAKACADKELALHKKASKAPETLDDLMRFRLLKLSPGCTVGEDNDGQIVVYTNLKEVDGKLVDLDALENVVQQRKLTGIVTEVTTVEKRVEVEVPKEWVTANHRKIEDAIMEEVSESSTEGAAETDVQVSWEEIE